MLRTKHIRQYRSDRIRAIKLWTSLTCSMDNIVNGTERARIKRSTNILSEKHQIFSCPMMFKPSLRLSLIPHKSKHRDILLLVCTQIQQKLNDICSKKTACPRNKNGGIFKLIPIKRLICHMHNILVHNSIWIFSHLKTPFHEITN